MALPCRYCRIDAAPCSSPRSSSPAPPSRRAPTASRAEVPGTALGHHGLETGTHPMACLGGVERHRPLRPRQGPRDRGLARSAAARAHRTGACEPVCVRRSTSRSRSGRCRRRPRTVRSGSRSDRRALMQATKDTSSRSRQRVSASRRRRPPASFTACRHFASCCRRRSNCAAARPHALSVADGRIADRPRYGGAARCSTWRGTSSGRTTSSATSTCWRSTNSTTCTCISQTIRAGASRSRRGRI